jgi:D-alanyl-D-alanine carboxypeptidase (penicillin-binding protein 5/6)
MKNDIFRKIVSTKSIKIPFTTRNYDRILTNKNKMLNEFEGSNGIKTGFTKKAGRCLVSSCYRDGMELVCVVLNCPPMFERSKNLLTESFDVYKNYKILDADNIVGFTNLNGKNVPLIIKNDIILPLSLNEKEKINIRYNYPNNIENIPNFDTEVGYVEIFCENNLIFKEKIYTII